MSCLRTAFRLSTLEPHGNRDVDFFQENQPPPERNHTRTYLYIWLSEKHPNHNKENERNFSSPSASIARHTFTVSRGLAANGVASAHFFFFFAFVPGTNLKTVDGSVDRVCGKSAASGRTGLRSRVKLKMNHLIRIFLEQQKKRNWHIWRPAVSLSSGEPVAAMTEHSSLSRSFNITQTLRAVASGFDDDDVRHNR